MLEFKLFKTLFKKKEQKEHVPIERKKAFLRLQGNKDFQEYRKYAMELGEKTMNNIFNCKKELQSTWIETTRASYAQFIGFDTIINNYKTELLEQDKRTKKTEEIKEMKKTYSQPMKRFE